MFVKAVSEHRDDGTLPEMEFDDRRRLFRDCRVEGAPNEAGMVPVKALISKPNAVNNDN